MKQDTTLRIEKYNSRLPRLKDKLVLSVTALLLAVIMLTTVSFAWLSLSVSPEVSNVSTSIASNGNLEIALASGTLSELIVPGATQLGDADLPILQGNLTWGNLINLSDPKYGLSNLVLRPAGLNTDDLLESPLYGADYIASGKHEGYIDSFRYATWQSTNPDDPEAPWEFVISNELGVRAISSTIMAESSGYAYGYQIKLDEAKAALREAQNGYISITTNVDISDGDKEKQFLESLAAVMGAYMTSNMNSDDDLKNNTIEKEYVEGLRDMFRAFIKVLELEQEAIRKLANLQLYVIYGGDTSTYTEFATVDALIARKDNLTFTTPSGNVNLQLSGLNENLSDYTKLQKNYVALQALCGGGEIKWLDTVDIEWQGQTVSISLNDIVNALVTVGSCTVNGTRVSSIGATAALDLNNKTCATIITNGVLYNFEKRTGARMDVPNGTTALQQKYPKGLPVTATGRRLGITMEGTIYALISTNAPTPSLFQKDINYAAEKNTGGTVQLSANDTYGFAIDFWVRTNAANSFLILEGNVLTETITLEVMGTDGDGNEVKLYVNTITIADESTGEEITSTEDVYQKDGKWYYDGTNTECTNIDSSNPPKEKVEIIENVIGYEGENRIWDDNAFLSIDSTTQGSGSCYVYYTETPEDMERSLKLLSAMKIAFIDAEGTLLAEGYMDTKNYFLDNGKVTVPMRLDPGSITLENPDGTETLAITRLDKNVAKLVTVIVYLDGTKVENQDVLAVSEIQGQMNIQFGSSVDLNSVSDEKLASKYLNVSSTVANTEFNYDESVESNTPMTTKVSVAVDGTSPERVSAFFVRAISSTQAIPLNDEGQVMNFTDMGGGRWEADYTFISPGTYIIRSIWVDGIEYDLEPNARPTVVVEGFSVRSLKWETTTQKQKSFMTASNSVSDNVILEFVTSDVDAMPSTVEGRFLRTDGNSVNVTFTRNVGNNKWYGKATFLSSGEYTLEYLVFDGEYYPVDSSMQRVADVYLGMKTAVYTDSPLSFLLGYGIDGDPSNGMTENEENLQMKIKIMDDTGNEMKNLSGVKLYYSLAGYTTEVNGLDADMTWNASTGYYEGEFRTKAGVFQFLYVMVGDNVIKKTANTSPRFIIQSPTPPSYDGHNTAAWQYRYECAEDLARFIVNLKDTEGIVESNMLGVISNGTTEYRVPGENKGSDGWHFVIPINNGHQDGTWTLTGIEVINIYVNDAMTTEENPYVIDLADNNIVTTVLDVINTTTSKTDVKFEGLDFLETPVLNDDNFGIVTIKDTNGASIPGIIGTIDLVYIYNNDSETYGGYKIGTVAYTDSKVTIKMKIDPNDSTRFVVDTANSDTIKYAGTYTLSELSFSFKPENFNGAIKVTVLGDALSDKVPAITVTSVVPTVNISAISPTGTVNTDTSSGYQGQTANGHTSNGGTSSISSDKLTTTVYYKCIVSSYWSFGTKYYHSYIDNSGYYNPQVTIELDNITNFNSATLSFSNNTHLYTNVSYTTSGTNGVWETTGGNSPYSWTKEGTCSRYVGYCWAQKGRASDAINAAGKKTPAGTITANTLTVVGSDGGTYTFTIPTITINNPY